MICREFWREKWLQPTSMYTCCLECLITLTNYLSHLISSPRMYELFMKWHSLNQVHYLSASPSYLWGLTCASTLYIKPRSALLCKCLLALMCKTSFIILNIHQFSKTNQLVQASLHITLTSFFFRITLLLQVITYKNPLQCLNAG